MLMETYTTTNMPRLGMPMNVHVSGDTLPGPGPREGAMHMADRRGGSHGGRRDGDRRDGERGRDRRDDERDRAWRGDRDRAGGVVFVAPWGGGGHRDDATYTTVTSTTTTIQNAVTTHGSLRGSVTR